MVDHWLLHAGRGGEYWDEWEEREVVSIGWDVGDLRELSKSETKTLIEKRYSEDPGLTAGRIRRFAGVKKGGMEAGDVVIILGKAAIEAVAEVGPYEYHEEGLAVERSHTYWRPVENYRWSDGPVRLRDLPQEFQQGEEHAIFAIPTLQRYKASADAVDRLVEFLQQAEPEPPTDFPFPIEEADLQEYLMDHINVLPYDIRDFEREYRTSVGDADFLCWLEGGGLLVVETKIHRAGRRPIGQVLAYVGAIEEEEIAEDVSVHGAVVAPSFSPKAQAGAKASGVDLVSVDIDVQAERVDA